MTSVDKYANYSAIQLATEEEFIKWVKCPDEDNGSFWQEFIDRHPLQSATVKKARAIVNEMQLVREPMDENAATVVWEKISQDIIKLNTERPSPIIFIRKWVAAAAVIVLIASAGFLLLTRQKTNTETAGAPVKKETHINDISPGNNKAILTLGDGSQVVLDSMNNGSITKQGNVTVIKMNGQLAYNKAGAGKKEIIYNTITTPKGGQYELLLADGSRVWLNAASSLRFPISFNGENRTVELTGEGYFEVTGDAKKPFIVKKGDTKITVLGTRFNANAYEDEPTLKVTLLEGRVRVGNGKSQVSLNPGQQAIVQNEQENISISDNVDVEEVVAWKDGRFLFNSADIETIMRQVARWYDVDVVYEKKTTGTISGALPRSENVSQLLKILEATGKVNFKIDGKKIIVKPK